MPLKTKIKYDIPPKKGGELISEYIETYFQLTGISNFLKSGEEKDWQTVDKSMLNGLYEHLIEQDLPEEFSKAKNILKSPSNIKSIKSLELNFMDKGGSKRKSVIYILNSKDGEQFYLERTTRRGINSALKNYGEAKLLVHNGRKYLTHTNLSKEDYENPIIKNTAISDHFTPYMHQLNAILAYGESLKVSGDKGDALIVFATGTGKTFIMGHAAKSLGEGIILVPNDIDAVKVQSDFHDFIMNDEYCAVASSCPAGQEDNFLKTNPFAVVNHQELNRFLPYMKDRNVFADEAQQIDPKIIKELKDKSYLMAVTATPTKELLDIFGRATCEVTLYTAMNELEAFRLIRTDAVQISLPGGLNEHKKIDATKRADLETSIIKHFTESARDDENNLIIDRNGEATHYRDNKMIAFSLDSEKVDFIASGYQALFEGKLDYVLGKGATDKLQKHIANIREEESVNLQEEAKNALRKNIARHLERNSVAELLGQGKKSIRKLQAENKIEERLLSLEKEFEKYQVGKNEIDTEYKRIFIDLEKEDSKILQNIRKQLEGCPDIDGKIEKVKEGKFSELLFNESDIDLEKDFDKANYVSAEKAGDINPQTIKSFKLQGNPLILVNNRQLETGFDDPDLLSVHRFIHKLQPNATERAVQMAGRSIRAKDGGAYNLDILGPDINKDGELGKDKPLLFSDIISENFLPLAMFYINNYQKHHPKTRLGTPQTDIQLEKGIELNPKEMQK